MNNRFRLTGRILSLCFLFLFLPTSTFAHEATDIYVEGIWATPCEDTSITTVFITVDNTAVAHPIALTSATSPSADHVHLVAGEDACAGSMADRIMIPFGEQVNFQESGYAIALEMNESYEADEPFSMILTFDMLDDDLNSENMRVNVVIGVPVLEEAPAETDILITGAWVRPTIMGDMDDHSDHMDMGDSDHDHDEMSMEIDVPDFPIATYLRLFNRGDEVDYIISASSPVADITELHESALDENNVMRMTPIDTLEILPNQWTEFDPGHYHIMLVDVNQNFFEGEAIPMTLQFESGTEITIAVPVYDLTFGEVEMDHSMHMDHGDTSEDSHDHDEESHDHDAEEHDHGD